MIYKKSIAICIALILVCAAYIKVSTGAFSSNSTYITWDGLEPDKWASIWLIKKELSPASSVEVRPMHSRTDDGVAFDIPGAQFYRNAQRSTYASLLQYHEEQGYKGDAVVQRIGEIIHDIDVNVWADKALPETAVIENAIRTLQQKYNRLSVPPECYVELFDQVYTSLSAGSQVSGEQLNQTIIECDDLGASHAVTRNTSVVAEIPVEELLKQIGLGKNVVFIDTRESEEFNEMHIPGALNIKLREVNQSLIPELEDADLIISYCVKDFRGYEVARAIRELGIEQSAIMVPYGIRGWTDLGLPVYSHEGLSQQAAMDRLQYCASALNDCLAP